MARSNSANTCATPQNSRHGANANLGALTELICASPQLMDEFEAQYHTEKMTQIWGDITAPDVIGSVHIASQIRSCALCVVVKREHSTL